MQTVVRLKQIVQYQCSTLRGSYTASSLWTLFLQLAPSLHQKNPSQVPCYLNSERRALFLWKVKTTEGFKLILWQGKGNTFQSRPKKPQSDSSCVRERKSLCKMKKGQKVKKKKGHLSKVTLIWLNRAFVCWLLLNSLFTVTDKKKPKPKKPNHTQNRFKKTNPKTNWTRSA